MCLPAAAVKMAPENENANTERTSKAKCFRCIQKLDFTFCASNVN